MSSLHRKLGRELWHLRGQMLSIALVVATGVMSVITMRGSYDTLVASQTEYYRDTRFASVWASLKRAPESVRRTIEQLPGVTAADTRITFLATLDLPDLESPGMGRFVSLPPIGRPRLNDVVITRGRYLAPGDHDAVIISDKFAAARGLTSGDSIRAVLNGRLRTLRVVGIALSPEHSYAVPPGSIYPDDKRYGVLWMSRDELGPAYDLDGAFNDVVVSLDRGADPLAVIAHIDAVLKPFGGLGAYARKDQLSHQILQSELDSNRVMSTVIPGVFLAVAAFLLNLVLGRVIATQRSEIAVLKAFGYTNRQVGLHFLQFALVAVIIGVIIGTALGVWLGHGYVAIYGEYFGFPSLNYSLRWELVVVAAAVSVVGAAGGAWSAVSAAIRLPPAEAMRAEPPARFEPGWIERLGIVRAMSPAVRMIARNVGRRPGRAVLSALGVSLSVAILVVGLFMYDGVAFMMDMQFRVLQREDVSVTFVESVPTSVRFELAHLPGVQRVELYRAVPVRLHAAHRSRAGAIMGVEPDARMRRIVGASGHEHPLPEQGIVIDEMLANRLRVTTGDTVRAELLVGRRSTIPVVVSGVVKSYFGVATYMNINALQQLTGDRPMASGAFLRVAGDERAALNTRLKGLPTVAEVVSPSMTLASFQKQMEESLFISVGFLLVFASVISVGVIYNGARVSLSERGRELTSLRVMGFRRSEVATLLLGEQAGVTAVAIPVGWALGYLLALAIVTGMQSETFRIPFVVSGQTYAISAITTMLAAVASGALVRRRINNLDLVAVLKTRE